MATMIDKIGTLFCNRRKELGLTREQLSMLAGVSVLEISEIEEGRDANIATINKLAEALGLSAEIRLQPVRHLSTDIIHYIVMSLGMFARQYKLTRREACNYLARFKGLQFSIDNYETEHQLSLQECVDDMYAICKKNGGVVE